MCRSLADVKSLGCIISVSGRLLPAERLACEDQYYSRTQVNVAHFRRIMSCEGTAV